VHIKFMLNAGSIVKLAVLLSLMNTDGSQAHELILDIVFFKGSDHISVVSISSVNSMSQSEIDRVMNVIGSNIIKRFTRFGKLPNTNDIFISAIIPKWDDDTLYKA